MEHLPAPDNKREYKAIAKAALLDIYSSWQSERGWTIANKKAFIHAYSNGEWPNLLEAVGNVSWQTLERWKVQWAKRKDLFVLTDTRGGKRKGTSLLTDRHKDIITEFATCQIPLNLAVCYGKICEQFEREKLFVPSYATMRRFIATLGIPKKRIKNTNSLKKATKRQE